MIHQTHFGGPWAEELPDLSEGGSHGGLLCMWLQVGQGDELQLPPSLLCHGRFTTAPG